MDTLRVDAVLLHVAGQQLRVVTEEFQPANANSDDAAEAVRSFAHNWDDHRAKMAEKIDTLAESARAVGEAFEELDTQFAAALSPGRPRARP